jgi:hypothetical protein
MRTIPSRLTVVRPGRARSLPPPAADFTAGAVAAQAASDNASQAATYRIEDLPERIASRINVNPLSGCWEWQGYVHPNGRGTLHWGGRTDWTRRVVYLLLVGPIPAGRELDHVHARGCRSKACCWPAHLEPVSTSENHRRLAELITHCPAGHEYTSENTLLEGAKHRRCRICRQAANRRYRERKAAAEGRELGPPESERTHCPAGHRYDEENTYISPSTGSRKCRACHRSVERIRKAAMRAVTR